MAQLKSTFHIQLTPLLGETVKLDLQPRSDVDGAQVLAHLHPERPPEDEAVEAGDQDEVRPQVRPHVGDARGQGDGGRGEEVVHGVAVEVGEDAGQAEVDQGDMVVEGPQLFAWKVDCLVYEY